jgi:DNA-binding GntR family transcriptional regulator
MPSEPNRGGDGRGSRHWCKHGFGPERATSAVVLFTLSAKAGDCYIVYNFEANLYATDVKPTDLDIYGRIFKAILARRLLPGARLGEEELAGLFGVSRTKVRNAIIRLAQDGVVQVRRNHGATIIAPTRGEASRVIEFRNLVEPPIAAALAQNHSADAIGTLRRHVADEQAARTAGDEGSLIRLTGEFHLRLAALHGNARLIQALQKAEALLCLCILSYGRSNAAACLPDEHEQILAAIAAGDADTAAALMRHHLNHVAAEMDLGAPVQAGLAAALAITRPGRSAA